LILRIMEWLARTLAIIGGVVLTALVLLTCVSVIGRGGNTLGHSDFLTGILPGFADMLNEFGPVTGDFEVVEAGIAFAIFAFLPICQLHGGHATVDVFTNMMPKRFNRVIMAFWEVFWRWC
jgi:TRAP-type C4-dicarboxylate transport system permease small subunit